jgi:hypothetical protein
VRLRRHPAVLASYVTVAALAWAGCGGSSSLVSGGRGGTSGGDAGATGGAAGTGGGPDGSAWDLVDASPDGLLSDLHQQLDVARGYWADNKSACATYSYDRHWSSVFSGSATSTEVEIRNDVPTHRETWNGNAYVDGGAWTLVADETGDQIGQSPFGFPASTMEQLLVECDGILARDPTQYALNLAFLPQPGGGILWTCTQRAHACVDDCEFGIKLARFSCAPLDGSGPQ